MNGAQSCDSYPVATIGSQSQPLAAVRWRSVPFGGVRGRKQTKAKKTNGYFRKPNNPRLYDNVSLTNDNVCRNPQNVSRKRKNVCIYSLCVCRFGGNADGIIIGGHYEADCLICQAVLALFLRRIHAHAPKNRVPLDRVGNGSAYENLYSLACTLCMRFYPLGVLWMLL